MERVVSVPVLSNLLLSHGNLLMYRAPCSGRSTGAATRRQRRLRVGPRPRARDTVPDLVPAVPPAAAAHHPAPRSEVRTETH